MPGGKLQLESYGEQNKIFNENLDITYFKIFYKRYTNFALETINTNLIDTHDIGQYFERVVLAYNKINDK